MLCPGAILEPDGKSGAMQVNLELAGQNWSRAGESGAATGESGTDTAELRSWSGKSWSRALKSWSRRTETGAAAAKSGAIAENLEPARIWTPSNQMHSFWTSIVTTTSTWDCSRNRSALAAITNRNNSTRSLSWRSAAHQSSPKQTISQPICSCKPRR